MFHLSPRCILKVEWLKFKFKDAKIGEIVFGRDFAAYSPTKHQNMLDGPSIAPLRVDDWTV